MEALNEALTGLFRKILEVGEVALKCNRCRVSLVHKGGGKSREDIGNYTPMTVMNIVAKVFGWVVSDKLRKWTKESKVFGEK